MNNPIKYVVENERDPLWGLSISTVGCEVIGKKEKYPTDKHQSGYYFSPERGRILQEYQLVYITEGQGVLQTESIDKTVIEAGTMFLLFPGEWHTYVPNELTGWKQYWIGFKGTNMEHLVKNGFWHKKSPVFHIGMNEEIVCLYRQAIEVADKEQAYFQQVLGGITNHLLGLLYSLDRNNRLGKNQHLVEQINRARVLMQEKIETSLSVQEIAMQLGMSYSSFRQLFKEYTGLSPARYFQEIKLQRAKALLCTTHLSVKEIAYSLNFESPDYFSTLFKKKTGKKPSDFRR